MALLTSALLGPLLCAFVSTPLAPSRSAAQAKADEVGTPPSPGADSPAAEGRLFAAADKVRATVVGIRARAVVPVRTAEGEVLRSISAAGSGVSVGPSLVLTSLHVIAISRPDGAVETVEEIEALFPRLGAVAAHVVAIDPALDLALLRLDAAVPTQAPAPLADGPSAAGELLAIGVLDGGLVAVPVQQVASADDRVRPSDGESAPLLRLAANLGAGFWGSPLFDAEGRLAGMVVASLPGHATAQPAAALRKLLENK